MFNTHEKNLLTPNTPRSTVFALGMPVPGQNHLGTVYPRPQWARVGSTLAITTDGNIVTSAALLGTGIPLTTPVGLKKYDLQGNLVWQTGPLAGVSYIAGKIPNPSFCPCVGGYAVIDRIGQISPASDGGIRLLGNEWGGGQVLTGVDATGRQTGSSSGGGSNFLATPDGGSLYTSSYFDNLGFGLSREGVVVEKTGNPSWTTRVAYPDGSDAYAITRAHVAISTPDGGYLLAGQYLNSRSATRASWVAKLDGQGNKSWQTIILIPSPGPGDVSRVDDSWDAIVSADGTGYALVGQGSTSPNTSATVLVEIDFSGKVKTGRVKAIDGPLVNEAYITIYTGGNGKKYYAVGTTSEQDRRDPQILLVDSGPLTTVAKRIFPGPGASSLIDIATAGDGSLVYVTNNNQLVKLQPEAITPNPPIGGSLALIAPTYNCATGAFTFNTSGGNGSPIEYQAPGITGWTTNPNQFVDRESRTATRCAALHPDGPSEWGHRHLRLGPQSLL